MRRQEPWLWLLLAVAAIAGGCLIAHAITHVTPIAGRQWAPGTRPHVRHQLFAYLAGWAALYVVAAAALFRAPRRPSVAVALGGGIALAVSSLARIAILSNDLYRYVWDGKVQAAGIDPYRYPPDAPQLARLHDNWLWPPASVCAARGKPPGCTLLNREHVHTIYPPAAQLYFRITHLVIPESLRDRGYEILGLILAAVVAGLLLAALRAAGRDPRWVAVWTLCPAVALEAVQNAHVDVVAVIAALGAVLIARRRVLCAAVFVAVAGLVKLYPLVLFPAVIQRRRVLAAAIVVGLFVAAYLPYVVDVGTDASGFLTGYLDQEGYSSGNRYVLLRLVGLSGRPASVVAVVLVVAVLVAAFLGRLGTPERAALIVFTALLYIATAGNPWYDLLLVALAALTGTWQWLGVIAGDYVVYLTSALGGKSVHLLVEVYGLALLIGLAVTLLRRRRVVTPARAL